MFVARIDRFGASFYFMFRNDTERCAFLTHNEDAVVSESLDNEQNAYSWNGILCQAYDCFHCFQKDELISRLDNMNIIVPIFR